MFYKSSIFKTYLDYRCVLKKYKVCATTVTIYYTTNICSENNNHLYWKEKWLQYEKEHDLKEA